MLPATIVVAIIAVVPPLLSALIDTQTKPDTVNVEYAKMDVDKRKSSAELLKAAMSIEDDAQRQAVAKAIFDYYHANPAALPPQLPYWPPAENSTDTKATSEAKK